MALVNLKIARALSRKRFALRVKTHFYQQNLHELELHITFTTHNIFVNLCNGIGNTFFVKTFGTIGYFGMRRKTRYALYYYGLEAGELLHNFLAEWQAHSRNYKGYSPTAIPIRLVIHTALLETDFRYKRFMEGLKKKSFYFTGLEIRTGIPYNGCRLPASRRTRRHRFFN